MPFYGLLDTGKGTQICRQKYSNIKCWYNFHVMVRFVHTLSDPTLISVLAA